jgi:hypothetical protein
LTVTNSFAEERFIVTDAEGYSTSLRMVDVKTLTQRIRTSRSTLQGQRDALAKQVAKQRFSSLDTLITIVMPGGLLYAAIKRGSQLEKRQDLAQLTQDINQLSGDLQSFEIAYGDLQIASLTH